MNCKLHWAGILLATILIPFQASAYDFCVDGIYYDIKSDNQVAVTYQYEYDDYDNKPRDTYVGNVEIPPTVTYDNNTYSVTSIGDHAFRSNYDLTGVSIPESVTSIGERAFLNSYGLTSVNIPESVTSIGEQAFHASALTSVTIPESVTEIGSNAFGWCLSLTSANIPKAITEIKDGVFFLCSALKNIVIPESVTSIGGSAFGQCSSLTSITIPESVTLIGSHAFSGCSGITSLAIPNSVTSIENYAFQACSGLTSLTISNSITKIEESTFSGCSSLTSVAIPESVTEIGERAFWMCSGLTSVTIPNSVTKIGLEAFARCSNLTSVTIPEPLTSIGNGSFAFCTSLIDINVEAGNTRYSSIDGVVFNKNKTILTIFPGGRETYAIPESTTDIGYEAFYGCSNLTSITIPNSVTSIPSNAFADCSSLTSVVIPETVTSIGDNPFVRCSSLTTIAYLPKTLNYIEKVVTDDVQLVYAHGYSNENKNIVDLNDVECCESALVHTDKFNCSSSGMRFQLKEYGTAEVFQTKVTNNAGEEVAPDESGFYNIISGSAKISYTVKEGDQYNDVSYIINPTVEFDGIEEVKAISTTESLQVTLRENPVSGATAWLKVADASAANVQCRLTSLNGSTIATSAIEANGQWQPLEINATPGLYLLTVSDSRTQKTVRLIVR